jgi:hypothetical protein
MKNKYEGIDEFEGYILETDIPLEEWKFGSKVEFKLYQPERLSEKTYYRNDDGTYPHLESVIGSDSLNTANN